MKRFVTKLRSPSPVVGSQRFQDRSRYMPHCGKKEYLKAWKRVLKQRKEYEYGQAQAGNEIQSVGG